MSDKLLTNKYKLVAYFISLITIIALWWAISITLQVIFLPDPLNVISYAINSIISGKIISHIIASLFRVIISIIIAVSVALFLGLILGYYNKLDALFTPLIMVLYPIPHIILLPILILWLGLGNASKIALISIIIFFPLFIQIRDSAQRMAKNYIDLLLVMGAKKYELIRYGTLPSTLPSLLTALKIASSTAFAVLFIVESIASSNGLGYLIIDAWQRVSYIEMYSAIVIMALLGMLFYTFFSILEHIFCKWINH
ncbi:MAG: ABC transporter permease [Thermoprotei archaeon]|jgi:NitT/TauT family transport system permease protein